MASTYSNLKIQLMATGENSTTWGDVTNTNLGTAIEEAIAGSADVTFASANVTLTLADTNISQTARNMRLRCTGTTGGTTRNLVVPTFEKPYIVKNDCADNVVVKTAAGTGITVPPGKSMWLYVDGTNVVEAVSYLSTLSFGGTVSIAQGGTGANTAADARTNLGLGTLATQNSNSVSITGGAISGASVATASATITGGSISGITDLAIADGGTGASNAAGARTNLLPAYAGNAGKILALNSIGTDVEWVSAGGSGTVLSVNASTGISGLSFTGGPITSSGTLILSGTLGVAGGGTGSTTAAGARSNLGAQETLVSGLNIKTINSASILGAGNIDTSSFPSGTKMLFIQTSAPTGWVKDTTHDNKALRIVSGTASSGGSVSFTSAFTSQTVSGTTSSTAAGGTVGGTALTIDQIPSHTHNSQYDDRTPSGIDYSGTNEIAGLGTSRTYPTTATGGGQAHSHPFTGSAHSHTYSSSINLAVQYVDAIIAIKS